MKRMLQPLEVRASSGLQQKQTNDEPCRIESVYKNGMGLDNRQDQTKLQLISTKYDKKLRPLSSLVGMHILVVEDNVFLQRLA